jgi:hypothetical protein
VAVILALPKLFDDVVARFALDGTDVPMTFGWREPGKHKVSTSRIVWTPGDPSGKAGDIGGPRFPGRNPRPIGNLAELFTVRVESVDASTPELERSQYQTTRELFDAWWRAVYLAAHGTVRIVSATWDTTKKERRYGTALVVVCSVDAMIPDAPAEIAPADSRAVVDVEELDHEETFETAPAPPAAFAATTEHVTLLGEQTIDEVELEAGDRVLVKDQADGEDNGLWVVAAGSWSRAEDADEDDEVVSGFFVHVVGGTINGAAGFELTTPDPIVLGTTPLVFERVSP